MDKEYWIRIGKRFLRAFVLGGMAQVALTASAGSLTIEAWADFQKWITILVSAFLFGGLMALDKALRNTPLPEEKDPEVK